MPRRPLVGTGSVGSGWRQPEERDRGTHRIQHSLEPFCPELTVVPAGRHEIESGNIKFAVDADLPENCKDLKGKSVAPSADGNNGMSGVTV
ncbi:hypothetical protein GCM10027402_28630 [Arthrobacter monumenti]